MEQKELIQVYALVQVLWPNHKFPSNKTELIIHKKTWFELLKDFDIKIVLNLIKDYSKTNEFFNVGIIAGQCEELLKPVSIQITENDVFNEIAKSLSSLVFDDEAMKPYREKYKYSQNPYSAQFAYKFDKLSPVAQRIVGSPAQLWELDRLGTNEFNTIIRSHILKSAKVILGQNKELEKKQVFIEQNPEFAKIDFKNKIEAKNFSFDSVDEIEV